MPVHEVTLSLTHHGSWRTRPPSHSAGRQRGSRRCASGRGPGGLQGSGWSANTGPLCPDCHRPGCCRGEKATLPLKTQREPEDHLLALKGHPPVADKGTAGVAPSLSLELRHLLCHHSSEHVQSAFPSPFQGLGGGRGGFEILRSSIKGQQHESSVRESSLGIQRDRPPRED